MPFNSQQIQGGKGANRYLYIYHTDPARAPGDTNIYGKYSWPSAASKPTIVDLVTRTELNTIIFNSAPDVIPAYDEIIAYYMGGMRDDEVIYVCYTHRRYPPGSYFFGEFYAEINTATNPWTFVRRLSNTVDFIQQRPNDTPLPQNNREIAQIETVGNTTWIYTSISNYQYIVKFNTSDFNSGTEKFENQQGGKTFVLYGSPAFNSFSRACISASSSGIIMNVVAELNQPQNIEWKHFVLDTNLDFINQSHLEIEGYVGWHCDWDRNYLGVTPADTTAGFSLCGEYPNSMFALSSIEFMLPYPTWNGILELNPTTLRPTTFIPFLTDVTYNTDVFNSSTQIQDPLTQAETTYGIIPAINSAENCVAMAVSAQTDDIITATKYNYRNDSTLSTDYQNDMYRQMTPDAPTGVDDDTLHGTGVHCPATVYRLENRAWVSLNGGGTVLRRFSGYNFPVYAWPADWTIISGGELLPHIVPYLGLYLQHQWVLAADAGRVRYDPVFSGDFDVGIVFYSNDGTMSTSELYHWKIVAYDTVTTNDVAEARYGAVSTGGPYGVRFAFTFDLSGVDESTGSTDYPYYRGEMRLRRVGNQYTMYWWTPQTDAWAQVGTTRTGTTNPINIDLTLEGNYPEDVGYYVQYFKEFPLTGDPLNPPALGDDSTVVITDEKNLSFIRPSTWMHSHPWSVRSLVCTADYIFVLYAARYITMKSLFRLVQLDKASKTVINTLDLSDYDTLYATTLLQIDLRYVAGNNDNICLYFSSGNNARLINLDVPTWTLDANSRACDVDYNPYWEPWGSAYHHPGGISGLGGNFDWDFFLYSMDITRTRDTECFYSTGSTCSLPAYAPVYGSGYCPYEQASGGCPFSPTCRFSSGSSCYRGFTFGTGNCPTGQNAAGCDFEIADRDLVIYRRDSGSFGINAAAPGVAYRNLSDEYYDKGLWAWNPVKDLYPAFFGFGGDSEKLYAVGLDVISGTTDMLLYEFEADTLELVRTSTYCVNYTPPYRPVYGHITSYL